MLKGDGRPIPTVTVGILASREEVAAARAADTGVAARHPRIRTSVAEPGRDRVLRLLERRPRLLEELGDPDERVMALARARLELLPQREEAVAGRPLPVLLHEGADAGVHELELAVDLRCA